MRLLVTEALLNVIQDGNYRMLLLLVVVLNSPKNEIKGKAYDPNC